MTSLAVSRWLLLLMVEASVAVTGVFLVAYPHSACSSPLNQLNYGTVNLELGVYYGFENSSWRLMQVPPCANLYTAMQLAGWRVGATHYGNLGVYVQSINGVSQSSVSGSYWQWYTWNSEQWSLGLVGASSYTIQSGDIILWYYGSSTPNKNLVPPVLR